MSVETDENNRSILIQLRFKSILIYYLDTGAMTERRAIRRTRSSRVKFKARPLTVTKKIDQKVWVTDIHQIALHQTLKFKMIQWESPQGHWCKHGITTMPFCGVPPIIYWFSWRISVWIEQNKRARNWKRPGLYHLFFPFLAYPGASLAKDNICLMVFTIMIYTQ